MGRRGSFYLFNASIPFGTYALVGHSVDSVSLRTVPDRITAGRNISILVDFRNLGQQEQRYVLTLAGAEDFAGYRFDKDRVTVLPGRHEVTYLRLAVNQNASGIRSVLLTAFSNTKSWSFPIVLNIQESAVVPDPSARIILRPVNVSTAGAIRLAIANPTDAPKRFLLSATAPWARMNYPSVIMVGPKDRVEVSVDLFPNPRVSGQNQVRLTLSLEGRVLIDEELPVLVQPLEKKELPIALFIIIALIAFVVVIRIIFRPKRPKVVRGGRYEA